MAVQSSKNPGLSGTNWKNINEITETLATTQVWQKKKTLIWFFWDFLFYTKYL